MFANHSLCAILLALGINACGAPSGPPQAPITPPVVIVPAVPSTPPPLSPAAGKWQILWSDLQTQGIHRDDATGSIALPINGHTPSWTPGGSIIYATPPGDAIGLADSNGANGVVIRSGLAQYGSAFRPQMVGSTVLFTIRGGQGSGNGLYKMHSDGTALSQIVAGDISAGYLSPDAVWATYTLQTVDASTPAGFHREIHRINLDGTGHQALTFAGVDPLHPDGNASAITPLGDQVAVFWGVEDFGQPVTQWGRRDVALMPAAGGALTVLVASTPATTPAALANYPPLPAVLAADNPGVSIDQSGHVWLNYDGGRPDANAGVFLIWLDGLGGNRLSGTQSGAGSNVPIRWVP
jgi:hypothetical protein